MARVNLGPFVLEGIEILVGQDAPPGTPDDVLLTMFLTDVLGIDGEKISNITMKTWHSPETYEDLVRIQVDMDDYYETVLRMKHPEIFG